MARSWQQKIGEVSILTVLKASFTTYKNKFPFCFFEVLDPWILPTLVLSPLTRCVKAEL